MLVKTNYDKMVIEKYYKVKQTEERNKYEHYANDETSTRLAKKIKRHTRRIS